MNYTAQYKRKQAPADGGGNAYKATITATSNEEARDKAAAQCKTNYRLIAVYPREQNT